MENVLPMRKRNRLDFNYSQSGAYFITICTKDRACILSSVVGDATLGVPQIKLTNYGIIVDNLIKNIDHVYKNVSVSSYVIMPNHIQLLLMFNDGTPKGASPTISALAEIINALKGLSTKRAGINLWQRSYYDHIIRDEHDYEIRWNYIEDNARRWQEDVYYNSNGMPKEASPTE